MVQFNLLPDIKQQFIKARQSQRVVITVASIVAVACIFILVVMFTVVNVLQKKHLKDVNNDITKYNSQLQTDPNLPKILTVQNQLKTLPGLHASKPVTSRLFDAKDKKGYLSKIVPAKVNISQLNIDFGLHTMIFTGDADSISTINQFVDTLKFTTYTLPGVTVAKDAFPSVVLGSFARTEKGATYTINLTYDPAIFNSSANPNLVVPSKITTRSSTDKPSDLFKPVPTTPTTDQGGQ